MARTKIKTADITADAITAAEIATDAVGSSEIAADAVDTAEIAASAVETAKINDDAVTYAKMQNLGTANRVLGSASTGVIGETQVTTEMLSSGAVTAGKIGASGTAGVTTFLRGDMQWEAVDTTGITSNADDIALIAFKTQANGSLARYNLVDQSVDAFEDASGIDASASTNEIRSSNNYYSGSSAPIVTGGTITVDGDYTIHSFTTGGDYVTDTTQSVDYLVIGGGGAGGIATYATTQWGTGDAGGGGGAGGYRYETGYSLAAGTYTIGIGAGGVGGTRSVVATQGGDTSFGSITTMTGGGLGMGPGSNAAQADGGSGGGGSAGSYVTAGDTDDASYGYAGGHGNGASYQSGGGGGGSAAVGANAGSNSPGAGGSSTANSITGSSVDRAGGGGGGMGFSHGVGCAGGQGGAGGGGGATAGQCNTDTTDATDGTGSGGGGGSHDGSGGDGGDGIVIIRRPTAASYNNMTLISNAFTAVDGAPDTADLVMTYTDFAGTASINTDLKAYISRNGSAYSTAVTLVSQGTTGGHTILTANGVDISGITSGTSMRYKIETLNQSILKQTRIQAVSLGWK